MSWLVTEIAQLITITIGLILVAALLAPFEALGWWAGWSTRWPGPLSLPAFPALPTPQRAEPTCYLVFFSGVAIAEPNRLAPKEQHWRCIRQRMSASSELATCNPIPWRICWETLRRRSNDETNPTTARHGPEPVARQHHARPADERHAEALY